MGKSFIDRFIAVMAAILIVCPLVTSNGYDDFVSSAESFAEIEDLSRGTEKYRTTADADAVVTTPAAEAPKVVVTTAADKEKVVTTTTTTAKTTVSTTTTTTSTTRTTTTVTYPAPQVDLEEYPYTAVPGSTIEIRYRTQYATRLYVNDFSEYLQCDYSPTASYYSDSGTIKVSIAPETPEGIYALTMRGENDYVSSYSGIDDTIGIRVGYPVLMYDINCDGKMSIADAVTLQKYLLGTGELKQWKNADIDGDGRIDVFDLCLLKEKLLKNNLVSTK